MPLLCWLRFVVWVVFLAWFFEVMRHGRMDFTYLRRACYLGLALLAFSGSVFAQAQPITRPVGVAGVGNGLASIVWSTIYPGGGPPAANQTVYTPAANDSSYISRSKVSYTKDILGKAAKLARVGIHGAVLTAALAAAGMVWDAAQNSWVAPTPAGATAPDGTTLYCYSFGLPDEQCGWTGESGCLAFGPTAFPSIQGCAWNPATNSNFPHGICALEGLNPVLPCAYALIGPQLITVSGGGYPGPNYPNAKPLPAGPGAPVSDPDVGEEIEQTPGLTPRILEEALNDPATWPEIGTEAERVRKSQSGEENHPDIIEETFPGEGNFPLPDVSTASDSSGLPAEPVEVEFPDFCTWATVVCDVINWITDEPQPIDDTIQAAEIPVMEEQYSSGLSGGGCPSSTAVNVLSTSVPFSYQPLCDAAVAGRPLVLVAASLGAGFILLGLRR